MRKFFLIAAGLAGLSSMFVGAPAQAAPKANTTATIAFSAPVMDVVTITGQAFCDEVKGSFCTSLPKTVTVGRIQIHRAEDALGNHVSCALMVGSNTLNMANGDPVNPSPGQTGVPGLDGADSFSVDYDTTGLTLPLGFQTHYIGGSNPLHNSFSPCADITNPDPLPDGTVTFTQGFYGASPTGEELVDEILEFSADPQGLCEEIEGILNFSGFSDTDIFGGSLDCTTDAGRDALAFFLTGTIGPGNDLGFLPAGNPSVNGPGLNLAAQKITLLLNLNLDAILDDTLDPPEIPIEDSYFLNIDPVADFVGGVFDRFYDPILTTGGELGTCTDGDADDVCDGGTITLTALGIVVAALDGTTMGSEAEGTTVAEILTAADDLIDTGDDDIMVNGVLVTRVQMEDIVSLINESYDEGTPTGFVTAFDAD